MVNFYLSFTLFRLLFESFFGGMLQTEFPFIGRDRVKRVSKDLWILEYDLEDGLSVLVLDPKTGTRKGTVDSNIPYYTPLFISVKIMESVYLILEPFTTEQIQTLIDSL